MQQWLDLTIRIGLFYVVIALGVLISKIMGENDVVNKIVTKVLINIMLPILMIETLLRTVEQFLSEIWLVVPLAILAHILGFVIFYPRVRRMDIASTKKGSLLLCVTFNNAVFLPVPLVLMFMGESGVPIIALYAIVEMILLAIIGTALGSVYNMEEEKRTQMAKKALLFPPLLAVVVGLILAGLGFHLPTAISPVTEANSFAITYLALLAVGLSLGTRISSSDVRISLEAVVVKQVVVPIIMWAVLLFPSISETTRAVLLLESMMPAAVFTVIYASALWLDSETAATIVTIGTVFLLPMIPVLALLI